MAFTTINLKEPIVADELGAYGAKAGQIDFFPGGMAIFAVNKTSSAITAGTKYVSTTGELKGSSASGYLTVKLLADCPAGAGIYCVAEGLVPGDTPAFQAFTVVS